MRMQSSWISNNNIHERSGWKLSFKPWCHSSKYVYEKVIHNIIFHNSCIKKTSSRIHLRTKREIFCMACGKKRFLAMRAKKILSGTLVAWYAWKFIFFNIFWWKTTYWTSILRNLEKNSILLKKCEKMTTSHEYSKTKKKILPAGIGWDDSFSLLPRVRNSHFVYVQRKIFFIANAWKVHFRAVFMPEFKIFMLAMLIP